MVASIALRRLMRIGAGASRLLPEVLGQLGLSRPFVVTDPYLVSSGRTDTLRERLTSAGTRATIFAETVPDPTVASVEAARDAAKAAGKSVELVVFPEAPHGFHADYRPSYRKEAAEDGWARALAFFKAHGV